VSAILSSAALAMGPVLYRVTLDMNKAELLLVFSRPIVLSSLDVSKLTLVGDSSSNCKLPPSVLHVCLLSPSLRHVCLLLWSPGQSCACYAPRPGVAGQHGDQHAPVLSEHTLHQGAQLTLCHHPLTTPVECLPFHRGCTLTPQVSLSRSEKDKVLSRPGLAKRGNETFLAVDSTFASDSLGHSVVPAPVDAPLPLYRSVRLPQSALSWSSICLLRYHVLYWQL
jgi:hypothetical protein